MPEGEVIEKKRGRPAAPAKEEKSESKKRTHDQSPKAVAESVPENGAPEAKRGRGRPKGSKKGAKPKKSPAEGTAGRGRGRPKSSSNDDATGSDY